MKNLIFLLTLVALTVEAKNDGILRELKLNSKNESENLKKAATAEALITKSEETALKEIDSLLKKYKGSPQEPDLLFRKAELFVRRAKSGRFFDLYRGDKLLADILKPELKQKGSKDYLNEALRIYDDIEKRYSRYPFLDEVLFNSAFAAQQLGYIARAKHNYNRVLVEFPKSELKWETHMALGQILFDEQAYENSLAQFEQITKAENSPLYPFAFYKMAWCKYNLKDTEAGIKHLEKVLEISRNPKASQHLRNEARRDLGLFYSDINSGAKALDYFTKWLNKDELAQTFLEMSDLYQRHGNESDAINILASFIEAYPKDTLRTSVQVKLIGIHRENKRDEKLLPNLVNLHKWCREQKNQTCNDQVKNLEDSLLSEWWEKWNKNRSDQKFQKLARELFPLYFEFENPEKPEADSHFAYAEIEFNFQNFKVSAREYAYVAHLDNIDKDLKHKSLYSAIVSASELKEEKQALHSLLDEYLKLYPNGANISQVQFQKAFLLYESKEWSESEKYFLALQKSQDVRLREKSEDLLFDIYNKREQYDQLKNFVALTMKIATGERKTKLNEIYQQSQLKLIELEIKKGKEYEAAMAYMNFHKEHQKSEIASQSLEAAIPLFFKNNKFDEAALASEKRAQELIEKEKLPERCKHLDKAMQAWLYIGQIDKALVIAMDLADIHPEDQKRKEYLLLAENLTQLLENKILTFKIWERLEKFLNKDEKSALINTQMKYFEAHAETNEAKVFFNRMLANKVEPYYSEHTLKKAQAALNDRKETQAFQIAKNIIGDNGPGEIKAQARLIQALILEGEFNRQSIRATGERVQLVLAMKTEKMDKAITAFGSAISMSASPQFKADVLLKMDNVYKNYVAAIESFINSENGAADGELSAQLQQVNAAIKEKSNETLTAYTALLELIKKGNQQEVSTRVQTITLPKQNQFHTYFPTWDDASTKSWLDLADVSTNKHSCEQIMDIKSERMLALKFHQCFKLKKFTESIVLTQDHLKRYPHSAWGAFYRSMVHFERGEKLQAQWYMDLALKKAPNEALLQYEKGRQLLDSHPEQAIPLLQMASLGGAETEESKLILGLTSFEKERCAKVSQYFENLHREEFKNFTPSLVILSDCLAENNRISEAVSLLEKSLNFSTNVLILIQRAKIAENFEKNKSVALKLYESARRQTDSEDLKNSLDQKIKEISVQSSTSALRTLKEDGNENRHIANSGNDRD